MTILVYLYVYGNNNNTLETVLVFSVWLAGGGPDGRISFFS